MWTLYGDAAATAPLKTHKLRGNVTVIEGSGGNIAVLTGPDGKVFVDAGITATRPRILEAVNSLGRDPIKHLINTHWHFDHTDGNQWLNAEGAAILAHENTHKHLLSAQRVEDWDFNFPSPPLAAVPTEVFSSEKTLSLNRSTLHLKYYGPAHTDSDISVSFSEADILHCGDTYWNWHLPVHRLLDRRKHRRNDQGGRSQRCGRRRQDDRYPRPQLAGPRKSGEQQSGAIRLSRHARRHP